MYYHTISYLVSCLECFVVDRTDKDLPSCSHATSKDLPVCFLRDQRTGRQRDLATLKLQLQFPHRRSSAQTPFSYTTEPFIFHLFQLSLFGEAVNLEKSCDTEGMGEEDVGGVSPLRRSWPPDSWDSTKHWVNIYLSYIFIGRERAKEREAGWRAPMLPLQHDREPGERRHICHRINFPLPGTWVSGAAPVCCTVHTHSGDIRYNTNAAYCWLMNTCQELSYWDSYGTYRVRRPAITENI